jgi:hypothetical protein
MTVVKIEGKNIQWKVFRARGGNWVGVCDPLGLTLQSDTWANLMEDIAHTLNAMLADLVPSGEMQSFLRDRGWRLAAPMPEKAADLWFDVPFDITKTADRDPEAVLR